MPHTIEIIHTLLSYPTPNWNYSHPDEQCMPHTIEIFRTQLSNAKPDWDSSHPAEQRHTLQSNATPYWDSSHPAEQLRTPLIYSEPFLPTSHTSQLLRILLRHAAIRFVTQRSTGSTLHPFIKLRSILVFKCCRSGSGFGSARIQNFLLITRIRIQNDLTSRIRICNDMTRRIRIRIRNYHEGSGLMK